MVFAGIRPRLRQFETEPRDLPTARAEALTPPNIVMTYSAGFRCMCPRLTFKDVMRISHGYVNSTWNFLDIVS